MFDHVFKANPYHDAKGRFARASGAHSIVDSNLKPTSKVVAEIKKRLTPDELARIEQYDANIKGKKTTAELHRDASGNWSPERQRIHEKIMADFFKDSAQYKAKKGETPTMVILGGRGGSGKSKLTDGTLDVIDASKFKKLDPDEIKAGFKDHGYDGTNAALFHEESGHVADMILQKAIFKKMNLVQDVTMRSESSVKEALDFAKKHGYDFEGHYMHLSREEAGVRAAKRGLKKDSPRYVPLDIIAGNTHNEQNFHRLKKYFKRWSIHSNHVAQDEKPILLDKSKE